MNKLKKFTAILAAFCFTVGCAAFAACGDSENEESDSVPQSSQSGETSAAGEEGAYLVTIVDQDGNPVSNVSFEVWKNDEIIATVVSDSEGKAAGVLQPGDYTFHIVVDSLPEGYVPDEYSKQVTIDRENLIEFVAEDSTPDGTKERPYEFVNGESGRTLTLILPADSTRYCEMSKAENFFLIVENANVKISASINNGAAKEYVPENGRIETMISAKLREIVTFAVSNTSTAEQSVTLSVKIPEQIIFGESTEKEMTAEFTGDDVAYYVWEASENCTFRVQSDWTDIRLTNKATGETASGSIALKKGEQVIVRVAANGESAATVDFTVSYGSGVQA